MVAFNTDTYLFNSVFVNSFFFIWKMCIKLIQVYSKGRRKGEASARINVKTNIHEHRESARWKNVERQNVEIRNILCLFEPCLNINNVNQWKIFRCYFSPDQFHCTIAEKYLSRAEKQSKTNFTMRSRWKSAASKWFCFVNKFRQGYVCAMPTRNDWNAWFYWQTRPTNNHVHS